MAFSLPTFNLVCNVDDMAGGTWLTRTTRVAGLACNLAMGRRVQQFSDGSANTYGGAAAPSLLVPALSDIRDWSSNGQADMIECPAGSGRWYAVSLVDDVAKGFSNEYRLVWMEKAFQAVDPGRYAGLAWPMPIP